MCGIFEYLNFLTPKTRKETADILIQGIERMEYRGYDSAGLHFGVVFMVVIALIFFYTGWQLGVVWNIIQERWPEYHDHCLKSFPEIANRSMGRRAKKFTSLLINITLFDICVVYLLLTANSAHYFVDNFLPGPLWISYCWTIVVLVVMLLPFTYLKCPAYFWPVIVLDMVTTTLAVVAIVAGVLRDAPVCKPAELFPPVETNKVIISIDLALFRSSSGALRVASVGMDCTITVLEMGGAKGELSLVRRGVFAVNDPSLIQVVSGSDVAQKAIVAGCGMEVVDL